MTVTKTTNFLKTVIFIQNYSFWKKTHDTLMNVVLQEGKKLWGI